MSSDGVIAVSHTPTQSLGEAFGTLLHADGPLGDLQFVLGSSSPDTASPLWSSLRALEAHAQLPSGQPDTETCDRLVALLLDFTAGKSRHGRRHGRAVLLLRWMLGHRLLGREFRGSLSRLLMRTGSPEDGRQQLAAAWLLTSMYETDLRAISGRRGASQAPELELLQALRRCAFPQPCPSHARQARSSACAPTLLAISASDAALIGVATACALAAAPSAPPERALARGIGSGDGIMMGPADMPPAGGSASADEGGSGGGGAETVAWVSRDLLLELHTLTRLVVWRRQAAWGSDSAHGTAWMLLEAATEEMAGALPTAAVGPGLAEMSEAIPSGTAAPAPAAAAGAGAEAFGCNSGGGSIPSPLKEPTASHLAWGVEDALLWAEALPLLREASAAPVTAGLAASGSRAGGPEHAGGKAATAAAARAHAVEAIAGRWLQSLGCGPGGAPGDQGRTEQEGRMPGGGSEGALRAAGADEDARAHRGLVCLCLFTAGLPPWERSAFFARHGPRLFHPVAAACAACTGAALPLAMLRALLPALLRTGRDASTVLQPLLDALQTTSRTSAAAAALVAELAISHPAVVLPDVLRLLSSRLASQRANGLAILHAATERIGLRQLTERSRLAEGLMQAVLPMLGDAELSSRLLAAGIFAHLEPPRAMASLAPLLLSRDARVRCAAEAAMLAALAGRGGGGAARTPDDGVTALAPDGHRAAAAAAAILDVLRDWPAVAAALHAAGGCHGAVHGLPRKNDASARHPTVLHPGQVGPSSPVEGPAQASEDARLWGAGLGGVPCGMLGLEAPGEGEEADFDGGEAGADGAPGGDAAMSSGSALSGPLAARFEARVLRLLDQWCATLDAHGWSSALRVVCIKFFAAADERASLRVLRRMVAHEAAAGLRHMLIPTALARMGHEGGVAAADGGVGGAQDGALSTHEARMPTAALGTVPPDSCGTRGGAGANTGDAAALARVRPLLMLNLLPEDAWSHACSGVVGGDAGFDTLDCRGPSAAELPGGACPAAPPDADVWLAAVPKLGGLLLARARDPWELRQTRKLATSLLARLPPGPLLDRAMGAVRERIEAALAGLADAQLPAVRSGAAGGSGSPAQGGAGERAATAGGSWDGAGDTESTAGDDFLDATLALFYLCCVVSLHQSAATLVAESPLVGSLIGAACAAARSPADVQLQAGCKDCLARLIATCPLSAWRDARPPRKAASAAGGGGNEPGGAARVLAAVLARRDQPAAPEVLAMASQLMHATHGAGAAGALARRAIPPLLDNSGNSAMATIFTLAYNARAQLDESLLNALLTRALADTASADAHARLGALKLLGLVLAGGGEVQVWGNNPEQMLERVLRTLASLATIDPSREVRSLAQSLETAAFGGCAGAQG